MAFIFVTPLNLPLTEALSLNIARPCELGCSTESLEGCTSSIPSHHDIVWFGLARHQDGNGPFGGCIPFQIVDQAPDTPPPQQENKPPPPKHVYVIDKPVTKCDYAPPPNINWGNSAYYKRDVNATGEFSGAELEKRWAESDEEKEDVPVLADDSDIEQALASIRKDEKSAKKTGKLPILCESLG